MYFSRRQEIIGTPSAAGPGKAASGNLLNAANPAVSMSYTYDSRNLQLTITNDTIAKTVGYTYDENGRKVSLAYPDGETISYTRDARGQVTHLTSNQPGPGGEPPPTVDYAYNPDGSMAAMDYGFGMHVARTYDSATGRLVDLKYTKPDGTVISDFAYTHDIAGNILSKTTDFGLVQYGYDSLDRLVLADYDWKADETFTHDPVGNRTADANHPVWHYDAANQLLAYGAGIHDPSGQTPPTVPAFTFTYDANGSTVSKTDLAAGTVDQYGYSFDNRMSEVQRDGELVARYFYDHLSRRVRKDLYNGGVLTGATWFVNGQEGLLAEYDGSGSLIRKSAWQHDQSWSTNPFFLSNSIGDRSYYLTDHLSTPHKLVDEELDSVWQADWQVYGVIGILISFTENNFHYPGQYLDTETTLEYNYLRYYSPQIGRYSQKDPWAFKSGFNLYSYVDGNPVNLIDPMGLTPMYCLGCRIVVKCRGIEFGLLWIWGAQHCDAEVVDWFGKHHYLTGGPDPVDNSLNSWRDDIPQPPGYIIYFDERANCGTVDCLINKTESYHNSPNRPVYNPLGPNSNTWLNNTFRFCGIELNLNFFGPPFFHIPYWQGY